jgi:hypothetical protein
VGEYCGTYAEEVRDDRVQVLTTDGDQVVTLQDSDLDGGLAGFDGTSQVVTVTSHQEGRAGTYVYDLLSDRFRPVNDAFSQFAMGGSAPGAKFIWAAPANDRRGATQLLGELIR